MWGYNIDSKTGIIIVENTIDLDVLAAFKAAFLPKPGSHLIGKKAKSPKRKKMNKHRCDTVVYCRLCTYDDIQDAKYMLNCQMDHGSSD